MFESLQQKSMCPSTTPRHTTRQTLTAAKRCLSCDERLKASHDFTSDTLFSADETADYADAVRNDDGDENDDENAFLSPAFQFQGNELYGSMSGTRVARSTAPVGTKLSLSPQYKSRAAVPICCGQLAGV